MVAVATTLWGLNGVISKVVLTHGISPAELTECRMLGAFAGLAAVLLATQPHTLRVARREWPELIALGLIGLVGVQLLYLVALRTLPVGISVLIEYLAPVLVALYAWLWLGKHVGRGLWAAIGLVILRPGADGQRASPAAAGWTPAAWRRRCSAPARTPSTSSSPSAACPRRPAVATICIGFGVGSVFWVVRRAVVEVPVGPDARRRQPGRPAAAWPPAAGAADRLTWSCWARWCRSRCWSRRCTRCRPPA